MMKVSINFVNSHHQKIEFFFHTNCHKSLIAITGTSLGCRSLDSLDGSSPSRHDGFLGGRWVGGGAWGGGLVWDVVKYWLLLIPLGCYFPPYFSKAHRGLM